ncbi:MAG TPA: hypothetical protein DD379_27290 [Cyanobacteria bacterium UBA11162]|nr:hypothetical protein [Cyanobacteria bacterium UBA11162]
MEHFGAKAEIEVDTLNGNITIIPRHVVDIIGLPDEDRFRHYGGDFEFVLRAKKKGFKIILSSQLQATTDYQVNDVIRYMHPWWQWQLRPNFSQRKEILKGFTDFKSHYNIWHRVNINHFGAKSIPKWKYLVVYIRQVIKVLSSDFWLKGKIESEIKNYCQEQNIPPEITEQALAERSLRSDLRNIHLNIPQDSSGIE